MTDPRSRRRDRMLSPLTRRILAVNVIALAIPIAGLLYLGPYRDNLIAAEMEALRTQGEIFAGALGEGAIKITVVGDEVLSIVPARHIIRRLSEPTRVRARLYLHDMQVAADSNQLGAAGTAVRVEDLPPPDADGEPVVTPLLDMMEQMTTLLGDQQIEIYSDALRRNGGALPEVERALRGEIAGAVRQYKDGGLVLSVALPVQRYYKVFGALNLSKDGTEIEAALRDVRSTILLVFAGALVVTVALSVYLAGAIARPLNRLALAAERVRRNVALDSVNIPDMTGRRDEIGDLSGTLREMTDALRLRMVGIERFAADVAHEIKNPLTSLRSAVETAVRIKNPEQQQQLMTIIKEDVDRLDRLISDISDASRLDAELSRDEVEPVDIASMMSMLSDLHGSEGPPVTVQTVGDGPFMVSGLEGRLVQVFRNLITNAQSFSPEDGEIRLAVRRTGDMIEVTVEDDGPGIPEGKLDAIFDRFYSERPSAEKFGTHSGLGLSISQQIVEAHGGEIRAENRSNGRAGVCGARFTVLLPAQTD
ncbi:MAG: stimulus-sensing domain-containing protein [Alphaproteobacteria bacterium]